MHASHEFQLFKDRKSYAFHVNEMLRKGFFVADLHVHTANSDGTAPPKKVIRAAMKKGLRVAIADHNTIIDFSSLTNEEMRHVIPAIEVKSIESVDVIVYFYKTKDLEKFYKTKILQKKVTPYKTSLPLDSLLSLLAKEKCVVNIPHCTSPKHHSKSNFIKEYEKGISKKSLRVIDLFEIFNASYDLSHNKTAVELSNKLNKGKVVGSDAHTIGAIGNAVTYCRAKDTNEFIAKLSKGQTKMAAIRTSYLNREIFPLWKICLLHLKGLLSSI